MGAYVGTDTLDLFKKDWLMLSDFIDMWCGDLIGEGSERLVFVFTLNKKLVVKIDKTNGAFPNVSEWDLYNNIKNAHPKEAKLLAPCIQISNAGKILLQERTEPLKNGKRLPKMLPSFFADQKIQNWGLLNNRVVCHDYANHRLYKKADVRLVKPEWYSDSVSAPIKYMRDAK